MSSAYLMQGDVAALLHISPRTLERFRVSGDGPPFIKAGRRVLYRQSDLETWIASRLCHSTSEGAEQ